MYHVKVVQPAELRACKPSIIPVFAARPTPTGTVAVTSSVAVSITGSVPSAWFGTSIFALTESAQRTGD